MRGWSVTKDEKRSQVTSHRDSDGVQRSAELAIILLIFFLRAASWNSTESFIELSF
jgi:hypothetical protein